MLKHLQSHKEYIDTQLALLEYVTPEAFEEYGDIIQMFRHLNFDPAHELLCELYSHTGRPALVQIEILRAYILCAYLNISWERLLNRLKKRAVFRAIIGIESDCLPTLPSFYELSRRLMPTRETSKLRYSLGRKPTKRIKKNEKLPEKKKKRTAQVVNLIRKGNFASSDQSAIYRRFSNLLVWIPLWLPAYFLMTWSSAATGRVFILAHPTMETRSVPVENLGFSLAIVHDVIPIPQQNGGGTVIKRSIIMDTPPIS